MKKLLKIALIGLASFFFILECASSEKKGKKGEDWVEALGTGTTRAEAEADARIAMIENALGSYMESSSASLNGEFQYKFISSSSKGFVQKFTVITEEKLPSGGFHLRAKGLVNFTALGDALENRKREIGNPRMMIVFSEVQFGKPVPRSNIKSENELTSTMIKEGFQFVDQEALKNASGKLSLSSNSSLVKTAGELQAEILIVGESKISSQPIPRDAHYKNYISDLNFKIISVGTAEVLASITDSDSAPSMTDDEGISNSLKSVTRKIIPQIKTQISKGWQAGSTTRIVFSGINSGDFLSSGITSMLKSIRGVNSADERDSSGNKQTVEVKCFCSTFDLMRSITNKAVDLNFELKIGDVKPSLANIAVKKRF
ncbi:MAG: hypothetical protein IT569_05860 [Leptospiraceae bacterium]|nr:hypothetical protein [Leptospiraceae bacterium]